MTKKRNKRRNKSSTAYERRNTRPNPRSFFQRIGIKDLIGKNGKRTFIHLYEAIQRQAGKETADAFKLCRYDPDEQFMFCHRSLNLVKLWYGNDFSVTTTVAEELQRLSVPTQSKVLDIGGGPGHLAFWMAHVWDVSGITVADRFSHLGQAWAENIKEGRVTFIDAALPELKGIADDSYGVALVSRVLGFMDSLNLPSSTQDFSTEGYLKGDAAKRMDAELVTLAKGIKRVLAPGGLLIVVDSWSDIRVQLVGRAFEKEGLTINLTLFSPERVSTTPSPIVFTESATSPSIQDLPLGLATMIAINKGGPLLLRETAAESMRKLFDDVAPVMQCEYCVRDYTNIKVKDEIFEKEGLSLFYRSASDGSRLAFINSSLVIPEQIKHLHKVKKNGGPKMADEDMYKSCHQ